MPFGLHHWKDFHLFLMIYVMLDMVQRTLVSWAARCEFENWQNLACTHLGTDACSVPLYHLKAKAQHMSVLR
jgi:hypothetical protein